LFRLPSNKLVFKALFKYKFIITMMIIMSDSLKKVFFIKILELLYAKKINNKVVTPLREVNTVRVIGNVISYMRREKKIKLIIDDGSGQITVFADENTIVDDFSLGDSVLVEGEVIILGDRVFLSARSIRKIKLPSEIIMRALLIRQYKEFLKI